MEGRITDVRTAAKYLGIKEQTLYRLVKRGKVPGAAKIGGTWRIDMRRVEELFAPPRPAA